MQNNILYKKTQKKPNKTSAFFICVLIAAILWIVHALNTVYNYTIKIPVEFINIPQNKIPLNDLPSKLTLDIKASGLKLLLTKFNETNTVTINFNDLKTSNKQLNYVLSNNTINFRPVFKFETQIKQISPDTLYFAERSGFQKTVMVKTPLYIKCAQGFGYKKPTLSPSFVSIWGDTSVIKKIDTVYTELLSLDNLSQSVTKELSIIKPNTDINLNQSKVLINIEIDKLVEQTITIPVNVIKPETFKQANVFPQKIKVKFTSIQNNFNPSDTIYFKATATALKNANFTKVPVMLTTVPGNITIMSIEPKEVEVLLIKK